MRQLTFEDATKGRADALQRVEDHADSDWKIIALAAVRVTALRCRDFISDDVWEIGQLAGTREIRALGPVMLQAARLGWIRKTDRVRPSIRSHLSGKPIWQSLITT